MRGLIRAALVALSAVTVLLGVVPAAQATGPFIYWAPGGGTLWKNEAAVCTDGDFEGGQTLVVEVLEGGTWVTKGTYADHMWGCFQVDATAVVAGPGTYSFRASSRVPSTGVVLTTGAAAFTLEADHGGIHWLDSGEFEASRDWMGSGVRLNSQKRNSTRVQISSAHGQVVELQRKAGSRWVTASSVRAPASGYDVTLRIPVPARAGMSRHRFVNHASAWSPTVTTGVFTVYQSAGLNRTSYAAEARDYMARYCPKTPIHVDSPYVSDGQPGLATGRHQRGGGRSVLYTDIHLQSGMAPDVLRFVALHECAHVVQYRAVVEGRRGVEDRRAKNLWPRWGVEGQADCMAYQITREWRWFGYVNGCSKRQLRNAASMWRAYGGKYQASPYRW